MPDPFDPGPNIVLRSPNWLGDAIMTLPAVEFLRSSLPKESALSVLTPAALAPFWLHVPAISKIVPLSSNIWIASRQLQAHKFSSSIIFPNSLRTALEMNLARIPIRAGYRGHHRSSFLTHVFEKTKSCVPEHQQWHYLRLAAEILGQTVPDQPSIPKLRLPTLPVRNRRWLALCPGAEYGPAKRWLPDRFAQAASILAQEYNLGIILLGGPRDEETSAQTERLIQAPVENLAGRTSLEEFIAYLAGAALVLCNDSGAMHLASILRVPTVAVFGSTEPRLTGPLSGTVAVLRDHVPCSPCFLRECPIDFRCMKSVGVEKVLDASHRLLGAFSLS